MVRARLDHSQLISRRRLTAGLTASAHHRRLPRPSRDRHTRMSRTGRHMTRSQRQLRRRRCLSLAVGPPALRRTVGLADAAHKPRCRRRHTTNSLYQTRCDSVGVGPAVSPAGTVFVDDALTTTVGGGGDDAIAACVVDVGPAASATASLPTAGALTAETTGPGQAPTRPIETPEQPSASATAPVPAQCNSDALAAPPHTAKRDRTGTLVAWPDRNSPWPNHIGPPQQRQPLRHRRSQMLVALRRRWRLRAQSEC